jgi:hypothetical protein
MPGAFVLHFRRDNYQLTLFSRDRITSGDKPVCIHPFATDYQRGYRLGRRPVTSSGVPPPDSSVWVRGPQARHWFSLRLRS